MYFVTFRLADSIPQRRMRQWQAERTAWLQANPEPRSAPQAQEYKERFPDKIETWLDAGIGSCCLKDERVIKIIRSALRYFDNERYQLDEWVVMPNHLHLLMKLEAGEVLAKVCHSLKSFTATQINQCLGREGPLWQSESYDRIVRSPEELDHYRRYIRNNPERAGLKLDKAACSWLS